MVENGRSMLKVAKTYAGCPALSPAISVQLTL